VPREPIFTRDFNLVFTAHVFQGLSFFLFIHLPRFLSDAGANEVEIGVLIGVTAVSAIAIRPPVGHFLDSVGRRPVLVVGSLLNVVAVALYLTVDSLGTWLYVVRFLHGIAEGATFTALFTYATDIVPVSRRTEGLALFGVSGFIPMALAGLIGDVILDRRNFDELFVAATVLGLIAWLIILLLPERAPERAHTEVATRRFLTAVRRPALLPLWLVTFTFAVVITSYFTFLRTFIDERGFGTVGAFFAAYATTSILLRAFFAWLPERVGAKRVLFPAFGVLALGFTVLAAAGGGGAVILAGILTGAGHAYVFPILLSLTVTRTREQDRGAAMAFFTAIFDVGILVGGPLLGLIITLSGYSWMYLAAVALTAAGAGAFAVWDRHFEASSTRTRA
jgi:predicted MFS family arabinose efflux permease